MQNPKPLKPRTVALILAGSLAVGLILYLATVILVMSLPWLLAYSLGDALFDPFLLGYLVLGVPIIVGLTLGLRNIDKAIKQSRDA